MIGNLDLSNLSVDENGRVSFSGLTSGIDSEGIVDSIIAAKRVPVDLLEIEVSERQAKISAYNDLKTLLTNLRDTLKELYGAVSFQNSDNIFESKQAFASTSRKDTLTPSAATSLIGVSVTNASVTGSHDLEVLRVAQAHKVSSGTVNSLTDTLGTALGLTDGGFDIGSTNIAVFANDTLGDLRDRINAANTGASATGVAASIVSVSSSEYYLVLTSSSTGVANQISLSNETGGVLSSLGISGDGGTTFSNELQKALDARLKADGLLDADRFESDLLSSQTAALSNFTSTAPSTGSFQITVGASTQTINYDATTDTLQDLRDNINAVFAPDVASITVEPDGVRLVIDGAGSAVTVTDTDGLMADLGVDNGLVITRATNTIDDLFAGTTVSLVQAEEGTTIKIDVEQDLAAAKEKIESFVDAYNALRIAINQHNAVDEDTGLQSEDAGVLFRSPVLADIEAKLGILVGAGVTGVNEQFSVLAQLGINIVDNSSLLDPSLKNTLEFGVNVQGKGIDEALLNNAADVRKLFSFDFSSSNPQVSLLNFTGDTGYNAAGYTVNIQPGTGTNLALYSEQADNAYWSTVRGSISADGATAPDGTTSADGLVGDATNDTHYITTASPMSVTSGETYTFSTYVKAGDKDHARIALGGANFATDTHVDVNLSAGTIASYGSGAELATIEDAGSGWYRVSVTATATGTGNATIDRYARESGSLSFAGDGATVNLWSWGAQFEQEAVANTAVPAANPSAGSLISNAGTAPDGTNTAEGLDADATTDSHFFASSAMAVTSGSSYSFVTYAKAGDQPATQINFDSTHFGADAFLKVDLSSGSTLETGSAITGSSVVDAGSGWYRIEITAKATTTGNATAERHALGAAGAAFAGDGNPATADTYFWGGQFIDGTKGSSYTKTEASSVTGPTANVGGVASGADDGTATFANNRLTVVSGGAEGLELFYGGNFTISSVSINFTIGLAAQMFFDINDLLASDGVVESEIDVLTDQNTVANDRISAALERLTYQRTQLLERYIAMETALATANRVLESIRQTTEAMLGNS